MVQLGLPAYADLFPDLANKYREGEITLEASVAEAFRQFEQLVWARLASDDRTWREDVLQETLLRLHVQGNVTYSRHQAALRYTRAFARNITLERRRKHWREVAVIVDSVEEQLD